jgi:hypothetical protein
LNVLDFGSLSTILVWHVIMTILQGIGEARGQPRVKISDNRNVNRSQYETNIAKYMVISDHKIIRKITDRHLGPIFAPNIQPPYRIDASEKRKSNQLASNDEQEEEWRCCGRSGRA